MKACEPVHVQMNLHDNKVIAVNSTLQSYQSVNLIFSVIDLNGKILLEDEIQDSSEEIQINISILKGGTYFIKAFTTDGIVTKKFIKE